jgi:hypothetical protein
MKDNLIFYAVCIACCIQLLMLERSNRWIKSKLDHPPVYTNTVEKIVYLKSFPDNGIVPVMTNYWRGFMGVMDSPIFRCSNCDSKKESYSCEKPGCCVLHLRCPKCIQKEEYPLLKTKDED